MASLPPFLLDLTLQAVNSLLARESWARDLLLPHRVKTVLVEASGLSVHLRITEQGLLERAEDPSLPVDVHLTVLPGKWQALMSNETAQRMSAVRIAGDAALAQALAEVARDLRWDAEDDLASLIGDIPARRLVQGGRSVAAGLRDGAWRLAQNGAEYLTHERPLLVTPYRVAAWSDEVSRVRDDAERSDKRLRWLEQRVQALAGQPAREH